LYVSTCCLLTRPGTKREDYAIPFGITEVTEAQHFVGREHELEQMHRALSGDGSRHTVVLHGLGGIGKTQMALAYAKRHRNDYSVILWFNITDETTIQQSFAKNAERILQYHPSAARLKQAKLDANLDEVVQAVKAWLGEAGNTRWLAIYDNYDNPKVRSNRDIGAIDINMFLPDASQGSVVVTTRSAQVRVGRGIAA